MFKALIHKYLWGKNTPWVDIAYVDGKITVRDYNKAFVGQLREKHGDLTDGKSDAEIVKLFHDRENIEHEEPRLEVLHAGIDEDGIVKMKLDWNQSFIRHLRENGIVGETDEEAIEIYLMMLSRDVQPDFGFSKEMIDGAFADVDAQLARESIDIKREVKKRKRRSFKGPQLPDADNPVPENSEGF